MLQFTYHLRSSLLVCSASVPLGWNLDDLKKSLSSLPWDQRYVEEESLHKKMGHAPYVWLFCIILRLGPHSKYESQRIASLFRKTGYKQGCDKPIYIKGETGYVGWSQESMGRELGSNGRVNLSLWSVRSTKGHGCLHGIHEQKGVGAGMLKYWCTLLSVKTNNWMSRLDEQWGELEWPRLRGVVCRRNKSDLQCWPHIASW